MKVHLQILQQEGYSPWRFLAWWIKNPFKFKLENKKPLVWTAKARFIYAVSGGFWPPMLLAVLVLWPFEEGYRWYVKQKTREKVKNLKKSGLKVIGITGSYGKTSVKEALYQILKSKYRVLRTAENYNTLLGVARVVDLELDGNYDFFICEMGAYKIGEIAELCEMVEPDYGVLTGINEQHLERFGSIENTIRAKFELVDYIRVEERESWRARVVLNFGSELVKKNAPEGVVGYGLGKYKHPQDQNIEGAAKMANILGVKVDESNIKLPPHRLTLFRRGEMTIIDDAYSSNVDGFRTAVAYLKTFSGWKALVTPGIAELGQQTSKIHQDLGKVLDGLDQVILVGRNERTKNLEKGYGKKVEYVDKVGEALAKLTNPKATVLFENDLPDNY